MSRNLTLQVCNCPDEICVLGKSKNWCDLWKRYGFQCEWCMRHMVLPLLYSKGSICVNTCKHLGSWSVSMHSGVIAMSVSEHKITHWRGGRQTECDDRILSLLSRNALGFLQPAIKMCKVVIAREVSYFVRLWTIFLVADISSCSSSEISWTTQLSGFTAFGHLKAT